MIINSTNFENINCLIMSTCIVTIHIFSLEYCNHFISKFEITFLFIFISFSSLLQIISGKCSVIQSCENHYQNSKKNGNFVLLCQTYMTDATVSIHTSTLLSMSLIKSLNFNSNFNPIQ